MKFGKRLLGEAARRWTHGYLDYKQLKHAIKQDVAVHDATGQQFEVALRHELQKVAAFYVEKEEELAAAMSRLSHASSPREVAALRAELQDLRKFVVLNHYAVVKATKKRNRHLQAACGEGRVKALRAVHILSQQYFFTSPKLAALTTQAEILAQELAPRQPPASEVLAEYQCPICLDLLRAPVLLTCAHRFCWGCLLAHCAASRGGPAPPPHGDGKPKQQQQDEADVAMAEVHGSSSEGGSSGSAAQQRQLASQQPALQQQQGQRAVVATVTLAAAEGDVSDDEQGDACATFDCAVCRKAQLLNLDRLQVDPHLDAFLQKLERQQRTGGVVSLAAPPGARPGGSAPLAIGGARAAAAAGGVDDMLLDAKPSSKTTSLAEASELAEAAAAAAREEAEAAAAVQPAAAPASPPQVVLALPPASPFAGGEPGLLPPQRPEHQGRLVVCLDLDGTLVTTFTPKRAPLLGHGSISYIVGRGGKLNPNGVFVVERPGLGDFLHRIAAFAEVVLFTAGLEDYARPICDAIESRYPGAFHHRLYRPATVAEDVYPCIKDMSRLGRDLSRCVLVDDTPLAFFRQPDHGVPVLQFRGDMDDRMLPEAVAPLLESLAGCEDVAAPLARRFNMQKWFQAQGLTPPTRFMHRNASLPQLKLAPRPRSASPALAPAPAPAAAPAAADASAAEVLSRNAYDGTLLVCDFDRTLVDYDAGERLCDELAPELTSLLSSLQMPANFVPVTNTVLGEMQRRGVSRDALVACLREMGREVPPAVHRMLQWASRRGLETVVLSDCNSVFIGHILTGARLNTCIRHVVTNPAAFQRVPAALPEGMDAPAAGPGSSGDARGGAAAEPAVPPATPRPPRAPSGFGAGWFFRSAAAGSGVAAGAGGADAAKQAPSSQRLVIEPRHDGKARGPHGCALCPANLCKGAELAALRSCASYRTRRVVYCGDGANDFCPALALGPQDVVLARAGHALETLVAERAAAAAADAALRPVAAAVHVWRSHDELYRLVQQYAA